MPSLEKIFTERTGTNAHEDLYALQTAALSAWTLLYSLLPPSRALNGLETHMDLFEQLLEAGNVDLRIAVGEAVVVLYESAYDHDDEASQEMVGFEEKKYSNFYYYSVGTTPCDILKHSSLRSQHQSFTLDLTQMISAYRLGWHHSSDDVFS